MKISKETRVSVVGSGNIGMSIVQALAQAGFSPRAIDIKKEALWRGINRIKENLAQLVAKGKFTKEFMEEVLERIETTTELERIRDSEVVIEAVFENME